MRLYFAFLATLLLQHTVTAQVYQIRYLDDGFLDYHDVQIYKWDADLSDGVSGTISYNENHLLLRFGGIELPPGLYDVDLQMVFSSVPSAGTLNVYHLNETDWNDPGSVLNPPATNSSYPTWSHVNYNARPWSVAGAVGGSDANQLMGSITLSAAGAYIFDGASAAIESATDIAFVVTMQNDAVLYVKESAPNNTVLPALIFTLLESYSSRMRFGGLDWNCYFHPFHSLR